MDKQITWKRIAAFVFAVLMAVAFMPILGTGEATAAASKGRLVKTVTKYSYNKKAKKWKKVAVFTYQYNKQKDPTLITKKWYNDRGKHYDTDKWTEEYTYKSGKRRTRSEKWNYDGTGAESKWTYDKYGNLKTYYHIEGDLGSESISNWKFTCSKSGYLKARTKKETSGDYTQTEYYKYSPKLKNGLPTKMAIYYKDGKWKKDYSFKFNKKGLVTKYAVPGGSFYHTVKYTYKNGRVTSATLTYNGKSNDKERYKFTYTKKAVKKSRYAKIINQIIETGDPADVGGEFSWY